MVNFSTFNELSLPLQDLNEFEEFFKVLENLKSQGLNKIRTDKQFTHYPEILPNKTFQEVVGQIRDRDKKRRLLSFINSTIITIESPLIKDEESEKYNETLENEYFYQKKSIVGGLACCDIWNTVSISFNSDDKWDKEIIILQKQNISDEEEIAVNIRHASRVKHLEYHTDFFAMLQIKPIEYCHLQFKNTNLNFTKLDDEFGFEILNSLQEKEFLNTFNKFSQMSWNDILKSSAYTKGLNYKSYDGDWFKNTEYSQKNIFKFRTSQKYRCFGYREGNVFFVLRFEIDHEISNNG